MATLGDYMNWLKTVGGHCQSGIQADNEIGMVPVTKLIGPSGKYVIHPGNNQALVLSVFIIDNFDRRLEVVSPFGSAPQA